MSKVVTSISLLPRYFRSSLVQKALVALSGGILIVFAIAHLLGNLLLILGDRESFNVYAANLNRLPLLHLALELLLLAALVVHVALTIAIARRNHQAKPQADLAAPWWRRWRDRPMLYTGPLVAIFLGVHLQQFRFGALAPYRLQQLDRSITDWYALVADTFGQPIYTSLYIAMMLPVALHLSHGANSAAQSLGLVANPWWERGSKLLMSALAIGFAIIPAWIFAHHQSCQTIGSIVTSH